MKRKLIFFMIFFFGLMPRYHHYKLSITTQAVYADDYGDEDDGGGDSGGGDDGGGDYGDGDGDSGDDDFWSDWDAGDYDETWDASGNYDGGYEDADADDDGYWNEDVDNSYVDNDVDEEEDIYDDGLTSGDEPMYVYDNVCDGVSDAVTFSYNPDGSVSSEENGFVVQDSSGNYKYIQFDDSDNDAFRSHWNFEFGRGSVSGDPYMTFGGVQYRIIAEFHTHPNPNGLYGPSPNDFIALGDIDNLLYPDHQIPGLIIGADGNVYAYGPNNTSPVMNVGDSSTFFSSTFGCE